MTALDGDLDLAGLPVPVDQAKLFKDGGQRVTLVPGGQRLDAALGEQTPVIGVTEVGALEHALHLLVCHQVGDGVHVRVAPVALMGHGHSPWLASVLRRMPDVPGI